MNIQNRAEALISDLKDYFSTNIELVKFQTLDKSSDVGARVLSKLIVATFAIFAMLFISIWLALFLSDYLEVRYSGFLIVGVFYTLIFLIMLLGIKPILEKPIRNSIIASAMDDKKDAGVSRVNDDQQNAKTEV
jgi:hypothetical protein